MNNLELKKTSNQVRKGIVTAVHSAKAGHPGGSLSAADIYTYLYFEEMHIDPAQPDMQDRDLFVLSKGHAAPVLYATLAERGFFAPEELMSLRKLGSMLQGHPDMRKVPGVDMSTGSLGTGISAAVGNPRIHQLYDQIHQFYILLHHALCLRHVPRIPMIFHNSSFPVPPERNIYFSLPRRCLGESTYHGFPSMSFRFTFPISA